MIFYIKEINGLNEDKAKTGKKIFEENVRKMSKEKRVKNRK